MLKILEDILKMLHAVLRRIAEYYYLFLTITFKFFPDFFVEFQEFLSNFEGILGIPRLGFT